MYVKFKYPGGKFYVAVYQKRTSRVAHRTAGAAQAYAVRWRARAERLLK